MSLRKLAIFVEGQTEFIFIHRLVIEIAGKNNVEFQKQVFDSKNRCPEIKRFSDTQAKYKIYLYDSCGEENILDSIKDNYIKLQEKNYDKIIGLRDIYRQDRDTYPKRKNIKSKVEFVLKQNNMSDIQIIFSIMEIETWFLAELNHYPKIDTRLTLKCIRDNLINLENLSDFEKDIKHPATTLEEIYFLVKKHWSKSEKGINKTIDNLDYENLYLNVRNQIPSLNQLITELDDFFSEV